MLTTIILAHGEAYVGQAALAAVVVGPLVVTGLLWWLHPGRWLTKREEGAPRSCAVGVAAWLLSTLATAGSILLFLTRDWRVLGKTGGTASVLVGLLVPGAVVALLALVALERMLERRAAGRQHPTIRG
jgi:hypothetical protein